MSTLRVWFVLQCIVLLLASLWLVPAPWWQLGLFSLAILANILNRISWKLWLLRIIPLLMVLLVFQLIVTPFYRPLVQQVFQGEWNMAAWWPLISGLLRLGTPFLAVAALSGKLSRPELVKDLAVLLTPLRWLGISIQRVQMIFPLGLRFFPLVLETSRQIRENIDLFVPHQPKTMTLVNRLRYWGMLYKSTFVQTLNSALQVGEALALRGWRTTQTISPDRFDWVWIVLSLLMGLLLYSIQMTMFILWVIMTAWMGVCILDIRWKSHARRIVA